MVCVQIPLFFLKYHFSGVWSVWLSTIRVSLVPCSSDFSFYPHCEYNEETQLGNVLFNFSPSFMWRPRLKSILVQNLKLSSWFSPLVYLNSSVATKLLLFFYPFMVHFAPCELYSWNLLGFVVRFIPKSENLEILGLPSSQ